MKKKSKARPDDKRHLRFLTVGQAARVLGISPFTLRLWESVGLVTPARSSGRFRLYTPELLEVLKRIKYLHDVGFGSRPLQQPQSAAFFFRECPVAA
jgi:hypothetical protein